MGKTAILPDGLKWEPLLTLWLRPKTRNWFYTEIFPCRTLSRIFGVPPFLLADPIRATLASVREVTRHFAITTFAPWVAKIERAFRQTVLSSGYALRIDLDELVKSDTGELYTALLKGRQGGWLCVASPSPCACPIARPSRPIDAPSSWRIILAGKSLAALEESQMTEPANKATEAETEAETEEFTDELSDEVPDREQGAQYLVSFSSSFPASY